MRSIIRFCTALPFAAVLASVPVQESAAQATSAFERTELVVQILKEAQSGTPNTAVKTALEPIAGFLRDPLSSTSRVPSYAELEAVLIAVQQAKKGAAGGLVLDNVVGFNADPAKAAEAASDAAARAGSSGVWLPSEADLILGLTDFVVERAQDEATYSFVLGLQSAIDRIPDDRAKKLVTTGFPRSYALIEAVDVESFQSLMPPMRNAFAQDLASLPQTLGTKDFASAMGWTAGSKEQLYAQGVSLVFNRGVEIARGESPAVVLSRFAGLGSADLGNDEARRALRLLGAVSREYALAGDSALLVVLGQPKQRAVFAAFMVGDLVDTENSPQPATVAAFRQRVRDRQNEITLLVQQFEAARATIEAAKKDTARAPAERTRDLIGAVLPMIATAWRFTPEGGTPPAFVDDALRLQHALAEHNYTAVSSWLLERLPEQMKNDHVVRYVAFGTSLASARSPEEVTAALRTAAAPVGSYRMKRNNYRSAVPESERPRGEWRRSWGPGGVSVTAFAGGAWARESVEGPDREDQAALGIAVPVGVEFSVGAPVGSASLFFSVLDLGNVASRRLGDDDTVHPGAEVGWEQVFAPGAYLVWGIKHTPAALGFGVQHVGGLRQSREEDPEALDVVRWGAFIGADLTLFRF